MKKQTLRTTVVCVGVLAEISVQNRQRARVCFNMDAYARAYMYNIHACIIMIT